MKKRIIGLSTMFLTIFLVSSPVFGETYQYYETVEGEESYESRWIIEEVAGMVKLSIETDEEENQYNCVMTPEGAVLEFSMYKPVRKTDFFAQREGETVKFYGAVNGRDKTKDFSVKEVPWGQPIPILLKEQFNQTEDGLDFWILDINKIRPIYLQAKQLEVEEIEVLDKKYSAYKIEVRLQGFLSAFWVSHYWLDTETKDCLKFEGDFGPGTSKSTMELMQKYE
ncbi:MAG: hypothetical protein ACLFRY_11440 [Spirochaetia bacterium]